MRKVIFESLSFAVLAAFLLGAVAIAGFYLYVIFLGVSEMIDMLPL